MQTFIENIGDNLVLKYKKVPVVSLSKKHCLVLEKMNLSSSHWNIF